jgi:hypothetical protein
LNSFFISNARKLVREPLTEKVDMLHQEQQSQKTINPNMTIQKAKELIERYKIEEAKFRELYKPQLEECQNLEKAEAEIFKAEKEVNENRKKEFEKCSNFITTTNERKINLELELNKLKQLVNTLKNAAQSSFVEFDWKGGLDLGGLVSVDAQAKADAENGASGKINIGLGKLFDSQQQNQEQSNQQIAPQQQPARQIQQVNVEQIPAEEVNQQNNQQINVQKIQQQIQVPQQQIKEIANQVSQNDNLPEELVQKIVNQITEKQEEVMAKLIEQKKQQSEGTPVQQNVQENKVEQVPQKQQIVEQLPNQPKQQQSTKPSIKGIVDVKVNYDGETTDLQTLINSQIEKIENNSETQPIVQQQPIVPQQEVVQQQPIVPQQEVVQQQPIVPQQEVVQQQPIVPQQEVVQQQPIVPQQEVVQQQPIVPQQEVVQQQPITQQPIVPQQSEDTYKHPNFKTDVDVKFVINGEKVNDLEQFIENQITKMENTQKDEVEPESQVPKVIEKETQNQEEQMQKDKEEAEQFEQYIDQQIKQTPQAPSQDEISKHLFERIKIIEAKLRELNIILKESECKNSFKEENLEEPYDEEVIKCKEVDNKILIHFEKRRANAEKIGDIIANIKYYGDLPEYNIKNYNEVYKNFEEEREQDTFLIKELIIGNERHL